MKKIAINVVFLYIQQIAFSIISCYKSNHDKSKQNEKFLLIIIQGILIILHKIINLTLNFNLFVQ